MPAGEASGPLPDLSAANREEALRARALGQASMERQNYFRAKSFLAKSYRILPNVESARLLREARAAYEAQERKEGVTGRLWRARCPRALERYIVPEYQGPLILVVGVIALLALMRFVFSKPISLVMWKIGLDLT